MDELLLCCIYGENGQVCRHLKLGLATAPVLFGMEDFPELEPLIERKFSGTGDVSKALDMLAKSNGLEETENLAHEHCVEAVRYANFLKPSVYKSDLLLLSEKVLNRSR